MTEINLENLPEMINDKMDRDMNNAASNIDFVVESYGPDTNKNWYRVYKSGWVEQGGQLDQLTPNWDTITLLKAMADKTYRILVVQECYDSSNFVNAPCGSCPLSTTQIAITCYAQTGKMNWEVKGKGAIE